jgi:hypothetical protein
MKIVHVDVNLVPTLFKNEGEYFNPLNFGAGFSNKKYVFKFINIRKIGTMLRSFF